MSDAETLLTMIAGLYRQLATAHAEGDRLRAENAHLQTLVPTGDGPPTCDPNDGPA